MFGTSGQLSQVEFFLLKCICPFLLSLSCVSEYNIYTAVDSCGSLRCNHLARRPGFLLICIGAGQAAVLSGDVPLWCERRYDASVERQIFRRQAALQHGGRICADTPQHHEHWEHAQNAFSVQPQWGWLARPTCHEIQCIISKVLVLITSVHLWTS